MVRNGIEYKADKQVYDEWDLIVALFFDRDDDGWYKRQTEVPLMEWNALKAETKKPTKSKVVKSILRKPVASADELEPDVVKRKRVASIESQECDAAMKKPAAYKGARKVAKSTSI